MLTESAPDTNCDRLTILLQASYSSVSFPIKRYCIKPDFEKEPSKFCSHFSETRPKGRYFMRPKRTKSTLAKAGERKQSTEERGFALKERRRCITFFVALLVVIITITKRGLFGGNVFKNPPIYKRNMICFSCCQAICDVTAGA